MNKISRTHINKNQLERTINFSTLMTSLSEYNIQITLNYSDEECSTQKPQNITNDANRTT